MIIYKNQYKEVLNPLGIEPRFNVGDSVWYLDESGIYEGKVDGFSHEICFKGFSESINVSSYIKYLIHNIGYIQDYHDNIFLRKFDAERKYRELTGEPLQSQKDLALQLAKIHIQQALNLGVSLNEITENVL